MITASQFGKDEIRDKITGGQTVTDEAISEIGDGSNIINDVNEITLTIATAIEEQTAATSEIAGNVSQSSGQVNSSADNLSLLGNELAQLVGKFKL